MVADAAGPASPTTSTPGRQSPPPPVRRQYRPGDPDMVLGNLAGRLVVRWIPRDTSLVFT